MCWIGMGMRMKHMEMGWNGKIQWDGIKFIAVGWGWNK